MEYLDEEMRTHYRVVTRTSLWSSDGVVVQEGEWQPQMKKTYRKVERAVMEGDRLVAKFVRLATPMKQRGQNYPVLEYRIEQEVVVRYSDWREITTS